MHTANDSNGADPLSENVKLQIGAYAVTIPAGSFKLNPNGRIAYSGVINGVSLAIQIAPSGFNSFAFKVSATGVNLNGLINPATVVLTIGDSGSTVTTAEFK
jgi:hypothetical protein